MALPSMRAIERAGLHCWPGLEAEWDGTWIRRAARGLTQRSNSVQCMDPTDDVDVEARIARARAWFEGRGIAPRFRQTPLTGPGLSATLDRLGWSRLSHTRVMAMELDGIEPDPRGEVREKDDAEFLAVQRRLRPYSDLDFETFAAIVRAISVPACGLVLRDGEGRAVSSALMAIADGIVVAGNVVTDRAVRRNGYAAALMRTGLAWAKRQGAAYAALNVEAGNHPAVALYARLGYEDCYGYCYRGAPP